VRVLEFILGKAKVTLGRATINEIVLLHDSKVSRHHARIDKKEAGFTIVDLDSTSGAYLNGKRVASAALAPGDVIKLGDTVFRFESGPPEIGPDIIPLPIYPCAEDQKKQSIDLLSDETWLIEEQRPLLRTAREFRKELGTHCNVPSISIFGYGIKTVTRVKVKRNPQGPWQDVDFEVEEGGDATVPEQSAVVEGSEIHPVQQAHGSLYVDRDIKKRLKVELTRP
jgi:hypothetical protein